MEDKMMEQILECLQILEEMLKNMLFKNLLKVMHIQLEQNLLVVKRFSILKMEVLKMVQMFVNGQ